MYLEIKTTVWWEVAVTHAFNVTGVGDREMSMISEAFYSKKPDHFASFPNGFLMLDRL